MLQRISCSRDPELADPDTMRYESPLIKGRLIKRYKRFLADVELESGEIITAHTANTGSMKGLIDQGNPVYLSHHDNPKRKLKYSWELVKIGRHWVGINTGLPNKLVAEGIKNGTIKELQGYDSCRPEVPYGKNSRIDLLLSNEAQLCYVEVKNVTMVENQKAFFPDAVSVRAQKHLKELANMVQEGHRAIIFYVIQRPDAKEVLPADQIDPEYGQILRHVHKTGVEILAYQAKVSAKGVQLTQPVPVVL